jgi:hypothetical protein
MSDSGKRYRVRVAPATPNDVYRYFGPYRTRTTAERLAERWSERVGADIEVKVEIVYRAASPNDRSGA